MQWIRPTNACVPSVYEAVVIVSKLVIAYVSAEIVSEGEESDERVVSGPPRCVRLAYALPQDALPHFQTASGLPDERDARLRRQAAHSERV